jgi:hypothetical protein
MLNNPLKNPLKEDKMGTFIFKSKRVRKGAFSSFFLFSILLLSLILVLGCTSSDDGSGSADDTTTTDNDSTTTTDTTAPVIAEVTAVTTPTNDTTPAYTFSSTEAGTITYGGNCTSSTTSASSGNNAIGFSTLSEGSYSDCTIMVTDSAANVSSALKVSSFTIDTTAPSVDNFTLSDTALKAGDNATVTLVFSEAVASFSSVADITVANGTLATMTSADNVTWAGTFTPTANTEDDNNTLSLATSYTDTAGNAGPAETTANYAVNTQVPTISSVTAGWGTYLNATDDDSDGTVTVVTSGAENGQTVTVALNSANYTGTVSDNSTSVTIAASGLQALTNGSSYTLTTNVSNAAGNAATENTGTSFTYDITAPTLSGGVAISSASGVQNSMLNAGDNVSVTATFSESVIVDNASGTPTLTLVVGSGNRTATYASGSESTPLVFQYTIQAGETDTDGISIGANALALNSGTIRDVAGNNATITHSSVAANSSYKVDNTAPTLTETTAVSTLTNDNSTQYTFSSSEGGTINVGGSCSSDNNTAVADNMTVSFAALADGTYSDCTITVTDSAGNSVTIDVNSFTIDTIAPTLAQVTAVTTPTNDNTSSYTFSSTEAGTISYSICGGNPDNASADNNTITFNALADETYSNCKISVTDNASNTSDNLSVSSFTIDTVKPVLNQVTPVTTPTKNTTPGYAFSSDEAGTISYGGCSPGETSADNGTNSISFGTLSEASYSCTVTVTDSAGNASSPLSVNTFVVDTTAPTVTSASSSTTNGLYKLNDNITVTVTFNETMIVDNSSGNPRIQLETGTNDRYANYISGNSSSVLSFLYTLQSGDNSSDLDYKATDSLSANSGTIRDSATNDATLTLQSPGSSGSLRVNKNLVIDGIIPIITGFSPSDNSSFLKENTNFNVNYSENILTSTLTTNTANTSCTGSVQLSSDNYSSCIRMNSLSFNNDNNSLTIDPYDNLSVDAVYKIKLKSSITDLAGNNLSSDNISDQGYTIWNTKIIGDNSTNDRSWMFQKNDEIYIAYRDNNKTSSGQDNFTLNFSKYFRGNKVWENNGLTVQTIGTPIYIWDVIDNGSNILYVGELDSALSINGNNIPGYFGGRDGFLLNIAKSDGSFQGLKHYDHNFLELSYNRNETISAISKDSLGNFYVSAQIGGIIHGKTNINSQCSFIAKYSPELTNIWVKHLCGYAVGTYPSSLLVDSSDNIYISIHSRNNILYSGIVVHEISQSTIAHSGGSNSDVFLLKINSSGDFLWGKNLGTSSGNEYHKASILDSENNYYLVTGITSSYNGLTHIGSSDIVVIKHNSSGDHQWSRQIGTSSSDTAYKIALDKDNNIYIAGTSYGNVGNQTNNGEQDIYLVKLNSSGTTVWEKLYGSDQNDAALGGIAVDSLGNINVVGERTLHTPSSHTTNGILLGVNPLGNANWTYEMSDIFFIKLDNDGNVINSN